MSVRVFGSLPPADQANLDKMVKEGQAVRVGDRYDMRCICGDFHGPDHRRGLIGCQMMAAQRIR